MKKYSEDKFEFKSPLTPDAIVDRLNDRTLKSKYLVMAFTNKDFIGRVEQNTFKILSSSFPLPYGATCIISGTITTTSHISLTTSLHKAFRVLFIVWIIAIATIFFVLQLPDLNDLLVFAIGMSIGSLLFRLYLHVMYVMARNKGLEKLKEVLQIETEPAKS